MRYDTVMVIVFLLFVYLDGGITALVFCPLTDLFKNPLHKIWMILLWPLTLVIWLVHHIHLAVKDYIEEIRDYYREK